MTISSDTTFFMFDDINWFDEKGKKIAYSVEMEDIEGYKSISSGHAINNIELDEYGNAITTTL